MSIFGGTFKPYVIRQLSARQALLSSETRPHNNVQQYTSAKTAWAKMVSFVNYSSNSEPPSDALAKKYVLEAGTLVQDPNNDKLFSIRGGFGSKISAYGSDLGNRQLGYRPMPGITSIEVQNKGAYGSLRIATVKFKAWDKAQLDDLEVLYMRPGYPLLLEWGWSMYIDTSNPGSSSTVKNAKQANEISADEIARYINKPLKSFDSPTIDAFNVNYTQDVLYDRIAELSEKFSGNYEGMLGKIENFSWEVDKDGSYNCTTTIISIGDIMDSLKMNRPPVEINTGNKEDTGYKTSFTQFMDQLHYKVAADGKDIGITPITTGLPNYLFQDTNNFDVSIKAIRNCKNSISTTVANGKPYEYPSYIQLAFFISIIREKFNFVDDKGNNFLNIELPIYDPENKYNNKGNGLCLASVDSVSIDPSVCIISNPEATWVTGLPEGYIPVKDGVPMKNYLVPKSKNSNTSLGVIGNIYLNLQRINYIFNSMIQQDTGRGEVHMYKFLKALMEDISLALGGINDFDIYVEDNRAVIVDKNYTELESDKNSKFQLNIFGNNSVVRDYKIVSKIFQNQATLIAISAQNRENLGAVNDSTQRYLNKGLSNRLYPVLSTQESQNRSADVAKQKEDIAEMAKSVRSLRTYLKEFLGEPGKARSFPAPYESRESAATILKSVILNVNSDANYRAVVPITTEITMDGISGIVIGQVFRLNPDILPKEYNRRDVGFVVTGIKNIIQNSEWLTTITAYIIILDQDSKVSATSFTQSQKNSIDAGIGNLIAADITEQQKIVFQYMQLLCFIKYFYENNITAVYTVLDRKHTDPFKKKYKPLIKDLNIEFDDFIRSSNNTTVLGNYNGQTITSDNMLLFLNGMKNIGITSRYEEFQHLYKDTGFFGYYDGKIGDRSFYPLLNYFLKIGADNAKTVQFLTEVLQNTDTFKSLSNYPKLQTDVIDQAKAVFYNTSKLSGTQTGAATYTAGSNASVSSETYNIIPYDVDTTQAQSGTFNYNRNPKNTIKVNFNRQPK